MKEPMPRVESRWPSAWLATLRHLYGNPAYMFAQRRTDEKGPPFRSYGENENRFLAKVLGDENALNDVLNLTMSLMPDGFHQRLADAVAPKAVQLGGAIDITHSYRDRYRCAERSGSDLTQPDHLIAGHGGLMAIELKVRSPSSIKQLLHYAALAALEEEAVGKVGHHLLLLLTPQSSLQASMKELEVEDQASAIQAMTRSVSTYLAGGVRSRFVNANQLLDVITRMTIAHMSFETFCHSLRSELIGSSGPAATTLEKLVIGAEIEFVRHAALVKRK